MLHKAWSSIEEVPYSFWRSSVKFRGHTALKIIEFDPDLAFPDCNSNLNSPMATKWCTKLGNSIEEVPYCFKLRPSSSTNGIFRLSVRLSHPFDYVAIIVSSWNFITNDQSKVHVKGQGQRSKIKVTEVTTRLNRFRTVTQNLNTHMMMKWYI